MVHQAENRWGFPSAKAPFDSLEKSIYTVWHDLIALDLEPEPKESAMAAAKVIKTESEIAAFDHHVPGTTWRVKDDQ
jgi:hypothetical protein